MKTFEDLKWEGWLERRDTDPERIPLYFRSEYEGAKQAVMEFPNGYGVSVLFGSIFYSDGESTYEVAVTKGGKLCYDTPLTDDVLGYQTKEEVDEIMMKVQQL